MDLSVYFKKSPLIPAIIQEKDSGQVLMLAYMNAESLQKTIETGYTWFYSRSRKELWNKGATSGHVQKVVSITPDCDEDALLITVVQTGPACHTGEKSCFYRQGTIMQEEDPHTGSPLQQLYDTIVGRRANPVENSYTNYLFAQGLNKILKKCGEECSEVIIAAKDENRSLLAEELCDLIYHLVVLMVEKEISLEEINAVLRVRSTRIGNRKSEHSVDRIS